MMFGDYIRTLRKVITIDNQYQFVRDFFKNTGATNATNIPDSTIKSWLSPHNSKRYRKCRIRYYFPDNEKLNGNGFMEFLSKRINTSWKELQEAFRSINNDGIVDLETNNQEVFYWSLLNQFQKIHELPLSENPTADALTASLSAPDNTQGEIVAQDETPPVQEYRFDIPKVKFLDREDFRKAFRKGPIGMLEALESARSQWKQPLKLKLVEKK